MTPTPPHFDRHPTRYPDPDHSVSDMELPPGCCGWSPPKPQQVTPMNETAPKADPLGPWAPYVRWLVLVALLILGPKIGLTPGQIPPFPADLPGEVKRIGEAVQRVESQQVQVMKAAGVPQQ